MLSQSQNHYSQRAQGGAFVFADFWFKSEGIQKYSCPAPAGFVEGHQAWERQVLAKSCELHFRNGLGVFWDPVRVRPSMHKYIEINFRKRLGVILFVYMSVTPYVFALLIALNIDVLHIN